MKTAIVTGVSSGIGQLIAEKLLKDGWKVYGLSRTKLDVKSDAFIWIKCDLANAESIATSLELVTESAVNLLVSNAGVAFEEPASAVSYESYEKMFSVNVLAPMLLVNGLKDKVTQSTIISISSVSDRLTEKDFALYCSSKAANTRYFESLADELKDAKVFTLLPDYVDTPMLRKLQQDREFDWEGTIKAEDLAKLTVGLADNKFSIESGSNVIVVTNSLVDDLKSAEKLYGFNTDTNEITRL
jgi:3-oxoacyl-[acyl-carrier protein] reductase